MPSRHPKRRDSPPPAYDSIPLNSPPLPPPAKPRDVLNRLALRILDWRLAFVAITAFFCVRFLFPVDPTIVKMNTDEMKFVRATDGILHVVGRWVPNDERSALETVWSGGYIDLRHNSSRLIVHYKHYNPVPRKPYFRPDEKPVQLVVRIGQDQWKVSHAPNGALLMAEEKDGLGHGMTTTRLFFPRPDAGSTVQFLGIHVDADTIFEPIPPRKLIEFITDSTYLGEFSQTDTLESVDENTREVMRNIYTWPFLTANYFDVDVRIVGIDGACLEEKCPEMESDGEGIARAYWRRLPGHITNSTIKNMPWEFETDTTPDIIVSPFLRCSVAVNADSFYIVHFGHANYISEKLHSYVPYHRNNLFMDTLHTFLTSLRRSAYPQPLEFHSSCLDSLPCPYRNLLAFSHKKHTRKNIPIFILQPLQGSMKTPINLAFDSIRDSDYEDPDSLLYRLDSANLLWLPIPLAAPGYYTRAIPARLPSGQVSDSGDDVMSWTLTAHGHLTVFFYIYEFLCPWILEFGKDIGGEKCLHLKFGAPYDGNVWLDPGTYERGKKEKVWRGDAERLWTEIKKEEEGLWK